MRRFYYSDTIIDFLKRSDEEILGTISKNTEFSTELTQKDSWLAQIEILKGVLKPLDGMLYFEFSIPRMGRRIDVVLIINNVIFVLEFKVGEKNYTSQNIDQVWDYALDLKNFHETSEAHLIAPVLISTKAPNSFISVVATHEDQVLLPIKTNSESLKDVIKSTLDFADGANINIESWVSGRYAPTPTIIEAALALYNGHDVSQISKSDASATNLSLTSKTLSDIIYKAKSENRKCICFVTGVPGAGKTLVGLNIAAKHLNKEERTSTVFLSGNGPLVAILREALTRDKVKREKLKGNKKVKKGEVFSQVKLMIQNVHHFRDECLKDMSLAPFEHVTIFDEAQRAWNLTQTSNFMKTRKGLSNFSSSEPEFLISCLDRHKDWAVVICLVGGGQEINTGEAGISEWIESLNRSFPHWNIYISDKLNDSEYAAGNALSLLSEHKNVIKKEELHLAVSRRSFRAEYVSLLIKNILDINVTEAIKNYKSIKHKYPIVITRDLGKAKKWLKEKARGTERYGIVVSSQAQRLKPLAIDVRSSTDPIHWFLDEKDDTRSSYYLEDVATEFDVQGLELDWACVTWDGDFRYSNNEWQNFSFVGSKWQNIHKQERKTYLKNAYRVLLTRARQGMVIVIPEGEIEDPTRDPNFYNSTYNYLNSFGFDVI